MRRFLVAYGNGDGTFAPAVPVSFLSSGFVPSTAADLNGDGKTDIAVPVIGTAKFRGGVDQVRISGHSFHESGGGIFHFDRGTSRNPSSFALRVSLNFLPPSVVDVNGDGKPDLIAQTQTVGPTQSIGQQSVDDTPGGQRRWDFRPVISQ